MPNHSAKVDSRCAAKPLENKVGLTHNISVLARKQAVPLVRFAR
jgi:hypothetical protein